MHPANPWQNPPEPMKRARKKEEKEVLTAMEWAEEFQLSSQCREVLEHVNQTRKQIAQELPIDVNHPGWHSIETTVLVLYGFKKNFIRKVIDPNGVMVCSVFPDVIGSGIVADNHRYDLEKSPTFCRQYRELLRILDQRFGEHGSKSEDSLESQCARDIKAELAKQGAQ
jgi:hypothetical protein